MRLIFMGTPEFALPSLRAVHEAGHEIAAVYTQPPRLAGRGQKETPSPVHEYALEHGLPVYTPESLKTPEAQAEFAAHKADAAVVAAYGLLLPKPILEACPLGCVNVHPSLLPRWRGAAPIQRAVMAGDTRTGICIMQMNEGLDTGDIFLAREYGIGAGETAGALHDRLAAEAAPLLLEALEGLRRKTLVPIRQTDTGITYAKKITKEECRIDWRESADVIFNKIRGLNPQPGAFFVYKEELIKLFEAETVAASPSHPPGTVAAEPLTVACGQGALALTRLQRPGKKPMTAAEMLRGHPIPPGMVLE